MTLPHSAGRHIGRGIEIFHAEARCRWVIQAPADEQWSAGWTQKAPVLIARPSITAPIASATSVEQLNDLIEATKLELDQSAIELLEQASAEQSDKGKSYARTQSS